MSEKNLRLINEISNKGNLGEFENTLERIIQMIHDSECSIFCCDTCENSSIVQAINGSFKSHIKIGFKKVKEKPIHIIWDIFHEFGHHLSGKPNGKERTVERESQAWDLGFEQLKQFPELLEHLEDFKDYSENCLRTYKE